MPYRENKDLNYKRPHFTPQVLGHHYVAPKYVVEETIEPEPEIITVEIDESLLQIMPDEVTINEH
jgi:hypothetical protein